MRAISWRSFAVVALGGLLLSACAGVPSYEPVPQAAKDRIGSTDVVVPVKQNDIYVYVPPSNAASAAGGGLVAALIDVTIDTVRASKAENAVKPLRDATADYSFDKALQANVRKALADVSWLHVDKVHVLKEVTSDNIDRALDSSGDSAVLLTTADYQLSNDADELTVTLKAALYPKSEALVALRKGKPSKTKVNLANALYHDTLMFECRMPNATTDRPTNIAAWSADNGAAMRAALDIGAAKVAWMLAADLQSSMTSAPGVIPNTDPAGTVVRTDTGALKFHVYATAR